MNNTDVMINNVISLCTKKDLDTWKISSQFILKNIHSKKYTLIVPEKELHIFKKNTSRQYVIISEDKYIDFKFFLKKYIPENKLKMLGWYFQQFIKIEELSKGKNEHINLIWDADTIPLKNLNFYKDEKINYYKGTEYHKPYFDFIKRTLNLEKKNNFSFIAQSFAAKSDWVCSFLRSIEKKNNQLWYEFFIKNIDFSMPNAFSEYETLGTFFYENYSNKMQILDYKWIRNGNSLIGNIKNLDNKFYMLKDIHFISFEKTDSKFNKFINYFKKIFN